MEGGAQLEPITGLDALVIPSEAVWPPTGVPTATSGLITDARVTTGYLALKRVLDVTLALFAVVVLAPFWVIVAVLVRCTSRGPVFFRQSRVGYGGRSFTIFKFRSMCADAEDRLRDPQLYESYVTNGFKLHAASESRVTRIGQVLRKTSLDELPQLLNVLRGDMSLVGPRPVVPEELERYGALAPCYLGVRPGITGMWQVNGRSQVQFPERGELDRVYFERRSIKLDLVILLRTPLAVVRAEGAY